MRPVRVLAWLVVASVLGGLGVDATSVAVARMEVPSQLQRAGLAAATSAKGQPATQHTATVALRAARHQARTDGLRVRARSFRLYPGGRVRLTATRTAPTLLLDRFEALRHFTVVSSTTDAAVSPYS
jgi:hypothetical protein